MASLLMQSFHLRRQVSLILSLRRQDIHIRSTSSCNRCLCFMMLSVMINRTYCKGTWPSDRAPTFGEAWKSHEPFHLQRRLSMKLIAMRRAQDSDASNLGQAVFAFLGPNAERGPSAASSETLALKGLLCLSPCAKQ